MATAKRICKVCGNEYDYCRSFNPSTDIFRWNDVACSPEHAAIYFARVEASRKAKDGIADDKLPSESETIQGISSQADEQMSAEISEEVPAKTSKTKRKTKSSSSKAK